LVQLIASKDADLEAASIIGHGLIIDLLGAIAVLNDL
jgi:hypothetical protein